MRNVDCWILEKRPYLDGKGNCKNGFHLHFPDIWMPRKHRMFITDLVKNTNIEQEYETLDSSASWNNWFLYGSRKNDGQGSYKLKYIVEKDGSVLEKPNDTDSSTFLKTLSIRNNPTGVTNKVLDGRLPKPKPKTTTPKILIDNDYHDWIRIGCILYTIDKENGQHRWDEFSRQSWKYDETYLNKTWSRFRDYNYTIGSLIYIAKQDDEKITVHKKKKKAKKHIRLLYQPTEQPTIRKLMKKCKEKGIKGYVTMSVDELCDVG